MARSLGFWNMMAARYARKPIEDEESYQRKVQITQTYLRPDMKLLEFGCGTGSTALIHAHCVQSIRAIDYSSKMIAIARNKAQAAGVSNVTFETSSIEEMADPDGSYDAILGLSVLHLLDNKEAVIKKVFRLLKPGGLFVSSTVCVGDTQGRFKWILPIGAALRVLPLVRVFTAESLLASLASTGFDIDHQWRPAPDKSIFIVGKKP
ncbi:MAG: class I SAM-dependent methyltransferase [Gammaproteobacteria bacterium]